MWAFCHLAPSQTFLAGSHLWSWNLDSQSFSLQYQGYTWHPVACGRASEPSQGFVVITKGAQVKSVLFSENENQAPTFMHIMTPPFCLSRGRNCEQVKYQGRPT